MSQDSEHITRDALEGAFRDLQSDIDSATPSLLTKISMAVTITAGLLTCLAYLLGRRVGRKRATIVEVHRL